MPAFVTVVTTLFQEMDTPLPCQALHCCIDIIMLLHIMVHQLLYTHLTTECEVCFRAASGNTQTWPKPRVAEKLLFDAC